MPAYSWTIGTPPSPPAGVSVGTVGTLQTISIDLDSDYGKDITTWQSKDQTEPDLDPTFTEISGLQVVAQAYARRLCMEHGTHVDNRDDGYNIRRLLNAKWSQAKAFSVKTGVEREGLKDERVYSTSARMTYNTKTRSIVIESDVDSMFGSFNLVLEASEVSLQILRVVPQ